MGRNTAAFIARSLSATLGGDWSLARVSASAFGPTWRADGPDRTLFVKSMPAAQADRLEAEADGLAGLADIGCIRVPDVAACWRDDEAGHAALAMEWLDLRRPDRDFAGRFGRALGTLHAAQPPEGGGRYGWRRDNRIGSTAQCNRWSRDGSTAAWIEFFAERRLGAMRSMLAADNAPSDLTSAVDEAIRRMPALFADGYTPRASLIHGDLWSGNWGMLGDGTPVVYDPAVSCSDPEAELAMMELFGGTPPGFLEAYAALVPLHPGYRRRRDAYQLYHLLNHALLFGGGYVGQSLEMARSIVRPS